MTSEIYALYNVLHFYKKTVVDLLNKIDANLAEALNNCDIPQTSKSSLKKYEISSHMAGMLPHYLQMLHTSEIVSAELLSKLNELGCDVQPEKDKSTTNPFQASQLQQLEDCDLSLSTNIDKSYQPIASDVKAEEILVLDNPHDVELKVVSNYESNNHSLVQDVDSNIESVLKEEIDLESNEDLSAMQNLDLDSEEMEETQMPTVAINIKDESHSVYDDSVSTQENGNDLQAGKNLVIPKSLQPQGSNPSKSKKSKKNKKAKVKSSHHCVSITDSSHVGNVQDSSKTMVASRAIPPKSPAAQTPYQKRRYNWREEAVKRLLNENLKTTFTWSISPRQKQNVCESEKKNKGSRPIFEIPDEELDIGQTCVFTHIESPSEFYILTDQTLLSSLETSLNEDMNKQQYVTNKYKSKQLANANLGKYCVAFLSDTRRWHRVVIVDWLDEQIENVAVQLIDYGDKCQMSYKYIKNMPELYATIPKMAIRSHFAGIYSTRTHDECPSASVDFLVQLSEIRKRTQFVIVDAVKEGNSYAVDLCKDGDSDGDSLRQLLIKSGYACEESSNQLDTIAEEIEEKIPDSQAFTKVMLPTLGATVEFLITGYITTCHFYAHILQGRGSGLYNNDFEQLHQQLKMNNVVDTYETLTTDPKVGELVLVKEGPDWFRGVCTGGDDDFEIFLVDFGYSVVKKVGNLRYMKQDLLEVPFQAVECVLNDCQEKKGVSGDISRDFFQKVMFMQVFQGEVLGCDEPLKIRLWDSHYMDITYVLKQWGIGEHQRPDLN